MPYSWESWTPKATTSNKSKDKSNSNYSWENWQPSKAQQKQVDLAKQPQIQPQKSIVQIAKEQLAPLNKPLPQAKSYTNGVASQPGNKVLGVSNKGVPVVVDANRFENTSKTAGALTAGILSGLTADVPANIIKAKTGKDINAEFQNNSQNKPVVIPKIAGMRGYASQQSVTVPDATAYNAGKLIGSAIPIGKAAKAAAPLTEKLGSAVGSKIAGKVANAAIAGAAYSVPQDVTAGIANKQKPADIAKNTLKDIAVNTLFAGGIEGLNSIIGRITKNAAKVGIEKAIANEKLTPKQEIQVRKVLSGNTTKTLALPEPKKTDFYISPEGNATTNLSNQPLLLPKGKPRLQNGKGTYTMQPDIVTQRIMNKPSTIVNTLVKNRPNTTEQTISAVTKAGLPIDDVINDIKGKIADLENKQYEYLKSNNGGKGVEPGGIINGTNQRYGRVSNNPGWYSDFYLANGKKPTNADLKELAVKHLTEGYDDYTMHIPANEDYTKLQNDLQIAERLKAGQAKQYTSSFQNPIYNLKNNVENFEKANSKEIQTKIPSNKFEKQLEILNIYKNATGKQERPFILMPGESNGNATKLSDLQRLNSVTPNVSGIKERPFDLTQEEANGVKTSPKLITPTKSNIQPNILTTAGNNPAQLLQNTGYNVVSSANNKKLSIGRIKAGLDNLYTRTVDINHPIGKVDDRAYINATNSKNSGGVVDQILTGRLNDRQGNKIGDSFADVIKKNVPEGQTKQFWDYMLHNHNIARAAEGKPVNTDFTSDFSAQQAAKIEQQHPDWKGKAANITNWIDKFMQEWGVNSGVIDKDLYSALREKYPNYIPTNRSFEEIENVMPQHNGKGFVDQSMPFKRATGSDRDIIDPVESIMNLVNRTVRTAKYNEVGQNILNSVRENPEGLSKYAEIVPEGQSSPTARNIVSVFDGGKKVDLQINDKGLLDSLQAINKPEAGSVEQAMKKLTGKYKALITTKNPIFAVRNVARDVPTYYINSQENNPLKATGNLLKAIGDVATNSETYQKYKGLGGGGSNFFNGDSANAADKLLKKPGIINRALNGIEAFNNITEAAPRVAEFRNVLDKTGDAQKAMYAANDVTTNFSRGGDITKAADTYIPYLNAGVQGIDKLARQFKSRPISTILKGATYITAPTLLVNEMNRNDPNYQALDNRTKDNYYLFPNGDGTFTKIPKSRELGVLFGSLAERKLRELSGDKNAWKGYAGTVATNFAPSSPIENNIFAPATYNLATNKDFAGRKIVPDTMKDRSPQYQYDEQTSEIAKGIAKAAADKGVQLSPKQIDYIIKSYTGVIGQLALPATTKAQTQSVGTRQTLGKTIKSQFTADPLYNNQEISDFYDNYNALKQKAADKNFLENIPSKTVTSEERLRNQFAKTQKSINDLTKQSKIAVQQNDQEKIKALRQKMIDLARKANNSMR